MRVNPIVLLVGLGVLAAGCSRGEKAETNAADSTRMADSIKASEAAAGTANVRAPAPAPTNLAREPLVKVTEETPGLLAQAKLAAIDAQHLAKGKYPEASVKSGRIERRAGQLVYAFEVQQPGVVGTELILLDANDGAIVNTIHLEPLAARNPEAPKPAAKKP